MTNCISNPIDSNHPLPFKSIVLVGMPGAGKSTIGRRLAARLALPFADSDTAVEAAAGMSIEQIFDRFGEAEFRAGERRVMQRLLSDKPQVISTGGGTFMSEEVQDLMREKAVSVWLRVSFDVLLERVQRRTDRPLLKGDGDEPRLKLESLLAVREPVYALADVAIDSDRRPADETVHRTLEALSLFAQQKGFV